MILFSNLHTNICVSVDLNKKNHYKMEIQNCLKLYS